VKRSLKTKHTIPFLEKINDRKLTERLEDDKNLSISIAKSYIAKIYFHERVNNQKSKSLTIAYGFLLSSIVLIGIVAAVILLTNFPLIIQIFKAH
jgi:hypothetical protein